MAFARSYSSFGHFSVPLPNYEYPGFQGVSVLVGNPGGIVDPGLNLRRQMAEQATRFDSAKN